MINNFKACHKNMPSFHRRQFFTESEKSGIQNRDQVFTHRNSIVV